MTPYNYALKLSIHDHDLLREMIGREAGSEMLKECLACAGVIQPGQGVTPTHVVVDMNDMQSIFLARWLESARWGGTIGHPKNDAERALKGRVLVAYKACAAQIKSWTNYGEDGESPTIHIG